MVGTHVVLDKNMRSWFVLVNIGYFYAWKLRFLHHQTLKILVEKVLTYRTSWFYVNIPCF